jgi:acyl-CoA synthetase (AMP-forming)/AMP-acid ligase II
VCVVGLSDDRLGEVPAALVVTDPSDPPTEAELIEAVRQQLAPYMAPVLIGRYGEMPLNAMFKKDRLRVTSLLQAQLANRTRGS